MASISCSIRAFCASVSLRLPESSFSNFTHNSPVSKSDSRAGDTKTLFILSVLRCVSGSKKHSVSTSSPQNSIRTGEDSPVGKRSTIPPRRENCPAPSTSSTRTYPAKMRFSCKTLSLSVSPTDILKVFCFRVSRSVVICKNASIEPTQTENAPSAIADRVYSLLCSHSFEDAAAESEYSRDTKRTASLPSVCKSATILVASASSGQITNARLPVFPTVADINAARCTGDSPVTAADLPFSKDDRRFLCALRAENALSIQFIEKPLFIVISVHSLVNAEFYYCFTSGSGV